MVHNNINICLSCDDNYAKHCAAVIMSVLENHKTDEYLNFYILSFSLSLKNKAALKKTALSKKSGIIFFDLNTKDFENCPIAKNQHFSLAAYSRLFIGSVLKEAERVIYLDCDLIVEEEISDLWNISLDDKAAGVVKDSNIKAYMSDIVNLEDYFNSGVLLADLKKWREQNLESKFLEFLKSNFQRIYWVDQDVLNSVLYSNVHYLDSKWNIQYEPVKEKDFLKNETRGIFHFITKNKPWNTVLKHRYWNLYLKYVMKTPWAFSAIFIPVKLGIKKALNPFIMSLQRKKNLAKLQKTVEGRKAVIWGSSLFVNELLGNKKDEIKGLAGIADCDAEKEGTFVGRYMVFIPEKLSEIEPDLIISGVVNQVHMKDYIEKVLDRIGIKAEVLEDFFVYD